MKKYIIWIIPVIFLLTSCGIAPWNWIKEALDNANSKIITQSVNSWIVSIPESKIVVNTQSGNASEQSTKKLLKIENYNVVLYSGTGKIDTLTTKGTVSSLDDGSKKCEKDWGKPFTFYNVLKPDGKYGLIEKMYVMCGSDSDSSYYIYDFQKWGILIPIEEQMEKYFGITNPQDPNYYITYLNLQSNNINEINDTVTISIPDTEPCVDGCLWYAYISEKLLQSKWLKRDWNNIHIPIQELLK